jgi:NAD(P)H-hydrate repair Nnr-like enzyme with NAD(P)H-hydrate dehydratase domain
MAGAAVLAGRSAYFAGSGLVICDVPEMLFPILQISLPEAICIPRKLGKTNYAQYDSIILGPGLGVTKESGSLVEEILKTFDGPLVIDADGINCICQYNLYQDLLDTSAQVILTPHPGEGKRLMGVEEIINRETFAVTMSRLY